MKKLFPLLFFSLLIAGITVAVAKFFKDGSFYVGTLGILISQFLFLSLFYSWIENHYRKIKELSSSLHQLQQKSLLLQNQIKSHVQDFHEIEEVEEEYSSSGNTRTLN